MPFMSARRYGYAARAKLHGYYETSIFRRTQAVRSNRRFLTIDSHSQHNDTSSARSTVTEQVSTLPNSSATGVSDRVLNIFPPPPAFKEVLFTTLLPTTCPGCGALSQETTQDEAGHYSRTRKAVKTYLRTRARQQNSLIHHRGAISHAVDDRESHDVSTMPDKLSDTPVCDRCHDLLYYSKGQSIAHPSIEDLADSIAESPFNRNHVYHVLDAADFPMSLIPNIFTKIELAKPRSQNRRSRHKYPYKPTLSFIITRSDLLGSTKEVVDKMMPYFQNVLRIALGRTGRDMRLGDVHLVSAKRGWWTKEIKDTIWERGGGNWMVGRVNVGKSNLFEVLFPKGSGERAPVYANLTHEQQPRNNMLDTSSATLLETSLLPPAQPEEPFPTMPIVSSLPGTTASPIRLPFGNHKGELIDLPGTERGSLEEHVRPENKLSLIMQHRPNVDQHVIKPGQSLLIGGGLIRVTPLLDVDDPSVTVLAYPFLPIDSHVTATEKAIGTQLQQRESGIQSILANGASSVISSAGVLSLTNDVTRIRAAPLLRAGVPADKLPFRVYSTDILIEGVGWIELVCQVRRRWKSAVRPPVITKSEAPSPDKPENQVGSASDQPMFKPFQYDAAQPTVKETSDLAEKKFEEFPVPQVEIFSPHGKHVAQRRPLGAWMLWDDGRKRKAREAAAARPRRSMKGVKKRENKARREASNSVAV